MKYLDKIQKLLSCKICAEYLALCMVEPLRCPGLNYNDNGELITSDGTLWSDIVSKNESKNKTELDIFIKENKLHLIQHKVIK